MLQDLPNSRPVHSLILSSHFFLCLPCLLPPFTVPCKMVLARPDGRETSKKNTSHGNEVLPQDTTHVIQRPCYQRGSPCQVQQAIGTIRRPLGNRKETQTAVVWSCLPFIRSGENHLARHNERGKKTRQTEEEVGRQDQGMDRPGDRQVTEGSGEQGKTEKSGCKIIRGAPSTLAVREEMMIIMTISYKD